MIFSEKLSPQIRSYKSERSIKSNITLIEFEDKDAITRSMALVKDHEGNQATVLFYRQKFLPHRNHGELGNDVFHNKTVIGEVTKLPLGIESLEKADELAFNNAKAMSIACGVTGIDADRNSQLSGMNIVIMADSENPNSINEESLQKLIGSLFGKDGPFKEAILFRDFNDKKLMVNLLNGGAEFVIDEYTYKLMIDQIASSKLDLKSRFPIYLPYIIKAMTVYLRLISDMYWRKGNSLDTRGGKGYEEFIKNNIQNYLNMLVAPKKNY